jgi:hypothetical protein
VSSGIFPFSSILITVCKVDGTYINVTTILSKRKRQKKLTSSIDSPVTPFSVISKHKFVKDERRMVDFLTYFHLGTNLFLHREFDHYPRHQCISYRRRKRILQSHDVFLNEHQSRKRKSCRRIPFTHSPS